MAENIEGIKEHVRVYIVVFVALAILTVVTVGASYLHVSHGLHITIALVIALIKASLVAGYFMHLITERQLIHWVLALCAVFFVCVLLLPSLANSDMAGVS